MVLWKRLITLLIIIMSTILSAHPLDYFTETSGDLPECKTIKVMGDYKNFYPVIFTDILHYTGVATRLEIGRASPHMDGDIDGSQRGAIIAKFVFHSYNWAGITFIDSFIRNWAYPSHKVLIADYKDLSMANGSSHICIWLRGGGTIYNYRYSNFFGKSQEPIVADGSPGHHELPYIEKTTDPKHGRDAVCNAVTTVNPSITNQGFNFADDAHFLHIQAKQILAKDVTVSPTAWADDVFKDDYKMMDLNELDSYITKNKHLPGIDTEDQVKTKGISVGDMQEKMMRKIEELTKYIIKEHEHNLKLEAEIEKLKKQK